MITPRSAFLSITVAILAGLACRGAFAADPSLNALQNMPDRGKVDWQGWQFDYYIENTNMEGVTLRDVRFRNHMALKRASVPVVRVKYQGDATSISSGCGPYPDKFYSRNIFGLISPSHSVGTIQPFPGKQGLSNIVRFNTRDAAGIETLSLFAYAEIGGYRLWEGWSFRSDGVLEPTVYSSGWSCRDGPGKNDHRHHPYWRLSFDVDGVANQYWQVRSASQKSPQISRISSEVNLTRLAKDDLALVVSSTTSSRHILVRFRDSESALADPPGRPWFAFSSIDLGIRRYHSEEDRGWDLGAKSELPISNPAENLDGSPVVTWVSTHLGHPYKRGVDDETHVDWHWTGPILQLENWE